MSSNSHSEIEAYLMCERRHYYAYGEKLQPRKLDERLIRGNVGHAVLAAYYTALKEGSSHEEAMEEAAPILWSETEHYANHLFDKQKFINALSVLIDNYWEHYGAEQLKVIVVEDLRVLKLTEEFEMPFKVDLLADVLGYGLIAFDHKFCADFYNVEKVDMNSQLPKYLAALNDMGYRVNGIWLNQLRTKETIANKADPSLKFERTPIPVTENKVVTVMREQMMAASRISKLKQMPLEVWEQKILRNPMACNMCPFTMVCSADLEQQDPELTRLTYYQPKEYR